MKQGSNPQTGNAVRHRAQRVVRHDASMSAGQRGRLLSATAGLRSARIDFDSGFEEENWGEIEAEIARYLGKL